MLCEDALTDLEVGGIVRYINIDLQDDFVVLVLDVRSYCAAGPMDLRWLPSIRLRRFLRISASELAPAS